LLAQQEGPAVKYHSDNGGEFTSELHDEVFLISTENDFIRIENNDVLKHLTDH
jgi:hypothetical protein